MNEKHKINSFKDLCNVVNSDNLSNLCADLTEWLKFYNKAIEGIREGCPEETEGKSNWEIAQGSFEWINDGKTDIKHVDLSDELGNEIRIKTK